MKVSPFSVGFAISIRNIDRQFCNAQGIATRIFPVTQPVRFLRYFDRNLRHYGLVFRSAPQ